MQPSIRNIYIYIYIYIYHAAHWSSVHAPATPPSSALSFAGLFRAYSIVFSQIFFFAAFFVLFGVFLVDVSCSILVDTFLVTIA